jgi:hypothetical protein
LLNTKQQFAYLGKKKKSGAQALSKQAKKKTFSFLKV